MSSIVIVIHCKAYIDNKAWDAMRFAGAALVEDMDVRIHLLGEGAELCRKNHSPVEQHANLEDLLIEYMECGIKVSACGKSLTDCNINEQDMVTGIEKGSMKELASWINSSDHALTF